MSEKSEIQQILNATAGMLKAAGCKALVLVADNDDGESIAITCGSTDLKCAINMGATLMNKVPDIFGKEVCRLLPVDNDNARAELDFARDAIFAEGAMTDDCNCQACIARRAAVASVVAH